MVATMSAVLPTHDSEKLKKPLKITLHEFMHHPSYHMEWVDDVLVEKKPVSLRKRIALYLIP